MLIKLMQGVETFEQKSFEKMKILFQQLSKGQNPDTFFITCADSRIIPSLITGTKPGDLFVIRNIGNIIPPHPVPSSEAGGIEYALTVLGIKDIIICGHSHCGAMEGLLSPDIEQRLPAVARWLKHSARVLDKIHEETDPKRALLKATKENIKLQIEHLETYPLVAERLARNELTIHGWFYEIDAGKIFIYDSKVDDFIDFEQALKIAIHERKNKIITLVAKNYLESLSHPKSVDEYQSLMTLFTNLQNNLAPIWSMIRAEIQQKMWEELGCFYDTPLDEQFISLVASGSQLPVFDLKEFQKNIAESQGYQQYIGQLLRSSIFRPAYQLKESPSLPAVLR